MKIVFVSDTAAAMDMRKDRPFRAPHYTCSEAALLGEVALAAGGILFLDEIERFAPHVVRRALGVVRSMECQQHPHTPLVLATSQSTLGLLVDHGYTFTTGHAYSTACDEGENVD